MKKTSPELQDLEVKLKHLSASSKGPPPSFFGTGVFLPSTTPMPPDSPSALVTRQNVAEALSSGDVGLDNGWDDDGNEDGGIEQASEAAIGAGNQWGVGEGYEGFDLLQGGGGGSGSDDHQGTPAGLRLSAPGIPNMGSTTTSAGGSGSLSIMQVVFPTTLMDLVLRPSQKKEAYALKPVSAYTRSEINKYCDWSSAPINTERGARYWGHLTNCLCFHMSLTSYHAMVPIGI